MKNPFKRIFPSKKQKEAENPEFNNQKLYHIAIHPNIIANSGGNIAELLLSYRESIELGIRESIEKYKDQIGYEPFKNHANVGSIFCDDTNADNHLYILIKYNIHYADVDVCKYVIEVLTIRTISLDEYLDHYNEGLKCGMIPKDDKQ